MKTLLVPGIVLTIGVLLITLHFWYSLLNKNEPFINQSIINNIIAESAEAQEEKPINATQAATYYRALLVFIKSDFSSGLKLVHDLNKRIYGQPFRTPEDFDPRKITDDYINPIAGI